MDNLPKYVKLHETEMRLRDYDYYRDAGQWYIEYKIIDGELLSWSPHFMKKHLHRVPLIEITKEEWENGNRGYI